MPEYALKVGGIRGVTLRGLGAAGYSWVSSIEGPAGVIDVRPKPMQSSAPEPPAGGPPPPSSSVAERFEIAGLAPGRVRVRFALRRPWEQDREPLETADYDIIVEPAATQ